jgi:hypothetical protein
MGTRCGQVGDGATRGGGGQRVGGVVGEDEPEAGLVGAVVVDLELKGVVELALDRLGRLSDGDIVEDGQAVE